MQKQVKMKIENGEGKRWKEHATLEGELPWINARRNHHLRKLLKIRPKGKEMKWRRSSHTNSRKMLTTPIFIHIQQLNFSMLQ